MMAMINSRKIPKFDMQPFSHKITAKEYKEKRAEIINKIKSIIDVIKLAAPPELMPVIKIKIKIAEAACESIIIAINHLFTPDVYSTNEYYKTQFFDAIGYIKKLSLITAKNTFDELVSVENTYSSQYLLVKDIETRVTIAKKGYYRSNDNYNDFNERLPP